MRKIYLLSSLLLGLLGNAQNYTDGVFIVNEGWFGREGGSVNFIHSDNQISYRVYGDANGGSSLGNTTSYGTIYGDYFYFVSKQNDGDKGGRLVVADAKTLQKIASINDLIGKDGRSFVGVDHNVAYIGTSDGVVLYDIPTMQVKITIDGTSGQIGNMIRTFQYVFAVKQNGGILVIDPENHTIKHTIVGDYASITQAKDGSVWAIGGNKLYNINPTSFSVKEYDIPTTQYFASWGAWNAGSFTYSNTENALYWINSVSAWEMGKQIIKFDINTKTFNEHFASVPGQETQYKQIPYGAALRINPINGRLILTTTESGWGTHYQKNWVHTYNTDGTLADTKTLQDHYWFPSMPVFPDNHAPVINGNNEENISITEVTRINLSEVVSDVDNLQAGIVKNIKFISDTSIISAEINDKDELVITPLDKGYASVEVIFNSNGKMVEKTYNIDTTLLSVSNVEKTQLSIYPNPTSDYIHIKSNENIQEVQILDISGKLVKTSVGNKVDIRPLNRGIYIVRIKTNKTIHTHKIMKQ